MVDKWHEFETLCEEQDSIMSTFWEVISLSNEDDGFSFWYFLQVYSEEAKLGLNSVDNYFNGSAKAETCGRLGGDMS